MSLDVYLLKRCKECKHEEENYSANITHNLGKMADQAMIYETLWRPDELGITEANQLIEPLTKGLERMKANPEKFKKFNAENGWGTYEQFVPWIEKYLAACIEYPNSIVEVSR